VASNGELEDRPSGEYLDSTTEAHAQRSLSEDVNPSGEGVRLDSFVQFKERGRERTRRHLAVGLLILVAVMAVAGEAAFIFGRISADGIREVSILFTPIVTLASAAFGFFFGRDGR
jgi:hypothetical protein